MKNFFKCCGIIVFVTLIGFSLASCKDGGSAGGNFQIKVVNENEKPITKVECSSIIWSVECNITNGNSQTFPVDGEEGAYNISVSYGEPSATAANHIYTDKGKTTTITLTAAGKLTSDKKGGFYSEP